MKADNRSPKGLLSWNRGVILEAQRNLLHQDTYENFSKSRIKRARKHFLYLGNGNRISDYYLDAGRGILGHDFSPSILAMKNALSKALLPAFPQNSIAQIRKMLVSVFPGYYPLIFSHRLSAMDFLQEKAEERILYWYPNLLSKDSEDFKSKSINSNQETANEDMIKNQKLAPILPFASTFSPQVLLIPENEQKNKQYSNRGNHSPFELMGLMASLKRLVQYLHWDDNKKIKSLVAKRNRLLELMNYIKLRTETNTHWQAEAHYLRFEGEVSSYNKIWKSLISSGILIPSRPDQLLCLSSSSSVKEIDRILSTKGD